MKVQLFHAPAAGHDKVICAPCCNRGRCERRCPPLEWLGNDKPRRENFISAAMLNYNSPDYKDVLAELSARNDPTRDTVEAIRAIPNVTARAICAMLLVGVDKSDVADLLRMSRRQLYRVIEPMMGT